MEEIGKKSAFKFVKYQITESSIKVDQNTPISNELSIKINLDAKTPPHSNLPELKLDVIISDKNEKMNIHVSMTGYFAMDNFDSNTLNEFLAFNAPAILFPYIRAYVSSMTALSGMRPVVLPTINLHGVGETLLKELNHS